MHATHRCAPLILAMTLAAALTAGCETTMTVRRYPAFYDPQLRRLAVLPFDNGTLHPRAGIFLAQRLAERLAGNGTYEVVGPDTVRTRLFAADRTLGSGATDAERAAALAAATDVQAFVTGAVRSFAADSGTRIDVYDDPWYYGPGAGFGYGSWHRRWGYGVGGYWPIAHRTRYVAAHVAADARLVRVPTGEVLSTTPRPVRVRLTSIDEPTDLPDDVLARAAEAVAARIVGGFAVVPRQVKVRPDRVLRLAGRDEKGRWRETDDFSADDEDMRLTVAPPRAADRNDLRVTIIRPETGEQVAQRTFRWSADNGPRELSFSPRKLAETYGPGDYEVRLEAADAGEAVRREFEIE